MLTNSVRQNKLNHGITPPLNPKIYLSPRGWLIGKLGARPRVLSGSWPFIMADFSLSQAKAKPDPARPTDSFLYLQRGKWFPL